MAGRALRVTRVSPTPMGVGSPLVKSLPDSTITSPVRMGFGLQAAGFSFQNHAMANSPVVRIRIFLALLIPKPEARSLEP